MKLSSITTETIVSPAETMLVDLDGIGHDYDCTCAWCLSEVGALSQQQEGDSHGICSFHADKVYSDWKRSKAG